MPGPMGPHGHPGPVQVGRPPGPPVQRHLGPPGPGQRPSGVPGQRPVGPPGQGQRPVGPPGVPGPMARPPHPGPGMQPRPGPGVPGPVQGPPRPVPPPQRPMGPRPVHVAPPVAGNITNDPAGAHCRVFVGNLNTVALKKEDVEAIFCQYGLVSGISMHKGYAFVQYNNPTDARRACVEDGKTYAGKTLGKKLQCSPFINNAISKV